MSLRYISRRFVPSIAFTRQISEQFKKAKPLVYKEYLESVINPPVEKGKKYDDPDRVDPRTGILTSYYNWNHDLELSAFAHRVGYSPQKLPSLLQAVTAWRYQPMDISDDKCNDRLAVIGKSVLLMFIREFLYFTYPNMPDESMLKVDLALASAESLAKVCERLGLVDIILTRPIGPDEKRTKLESEDILSDALTAVVGAVHFDQGPCATRKFVHNFILPQLSQNEINNVVRLENPKEFLELMLKQQNRGPPESRLLKESGRLTHFPTFVVGIFSDKKIIGEGAGTSLNRAEKEAMNAAIMSHIMRVVKQPHFPSFDTTADNDQVNKKSKKVTTQL